MTVRGVLVDFLTASLVGTVAAAAVADIRRGIIPNRLVIPAIAAFAIAIEALNLLGLGADSIGAFMGLGLYGGSLAVLAAWKPDGMGMGDAKLAALVGLVLGSLGRSYLVVAIVTAFMGGGLLALGLTTLGRRRGIRLPFAPFLAMGSIVAAVMVWSR